jgi:hypothetical protein
MRGYWPRQRREKRQPIGAGSAEFESACEQFPLLRALMDSRHYRARHLSLRECKKGKWNANLRSHCDDGRGSAIRALSGAQGA